MAKQTKSRARGPTGYGKTKTRSAKSNKGKKFSSSEKKSFKRGLFLGLFKRKKQKAKSYDTDTYFTSKYNPYSEKSDSRVEEKRKEFLRKGGCLSGIYDISDPKTAKFVKEYRDFIPGKEIYKRDRQGKLIPAVRHRFDDDFERHSNGRIKGSYNPDGFFEPD